MPPTRVGTPVARDSAGSSSWWTRCSRYRAAATGTPTAAAAVTTASHSARSRRHSAIAPALSAGGDLGPHQWGTAVAARRSSPSKPRWAIRRSPRGRCEGRAAA
jgi:hypothetical protein